MRSRRVSACSVGVPSCACISCRPCLWERGRTHSHTHARTRGHVPQVIEYIDVRGGGKCTRNVEVGAFAIDPFQCKR